MHRGEKARSLMVWKDKPDLMICNGNTILDDHAEDDLGKAVTPYQSPIHRARQQAI